MTVNVGNGLHELRDLLAIIHRDGGHYVTEHGLAKAVEDAHQVWANLQLQLEMTQSGLRAANFNFTQEHDERLRLLGLLEDLVEYVDRCDKNEGGYCAMHNNSPCLGNAVIDEVRSAIAGTDSDIGAQA